MKTQVRARLSDGVNTMIRVVSTLRRKEFGIVDLEMTSADPVEFSQLLITLKGDRNDNMRAVHQMEKVYGVTEIELL